MHCAVVIELVPGGDGFSTRLWDQAAPDAFSMPRQSLSQFSGVRIYLFLRVYWEFGWQLSALPSCLSRSCLQSCKTKPKRTCSQGTLPSVSCVKHCATVQMHWNIRTFSKMVGTLWGMAAALPGCPHNPGRRLHERHTVHRDNICLAVTACLSISRNERRRQVQVVLISCSRA